MALLADSYYLTRWSNHLQFCPQHNPSVKVFFHPNCTSDIKLLVLYSKPSSGVITPQLLSARRRRNALSSASIFSAPVAMFSPRPGKNPWRYVTTYLWRCLVPTLGRQMSVAMVTSLLPPAFVIGGLEEDKPCFVDNWQLVVACHWHMHTESGRYRWLYLIKKLHTRRKCRL